MKMNEFSFFDLKDKCICSLYCEYTQLIDRLTPLAEGVEPELMNAVIKLAEQYG